MTDLPLAIQHERFDSQGALLYQPNAHDWMMGWLGYIALANLTPNAVQTVTSCTDGLRLLNGSNSTIYGLAFLIGTMLLNFTVIGTDGGLIERPAIVTEALLAPCERLDMLFDAEQAQIGGDIFLKSLAFDVMENERMGGNMSEKSGMGSMMGDMSATRLPMDMVFNILKLLVITGDRVTPVMPTALSQVKAISIASTTERKSELSMQYMRFLINGRSFGMNQIAFDGRRGATEIWSISNAAVGMPHPMHLHGFSFQMLQRLNSPPQVAGTAGFGNRRAVTDLGWKDTVLVWPGETVPIAIDFAHDFPGSQTYLFHCHNLEHEDGGMMSNFRVQA